MYPIGTDENEKLMKAIKKNFKSQEGVIDRYMVLRNNKNVDLKPVKTPRKIASPVNKEDPNDAKFNIDWE